MAARTRGFTFYELLGVSEDADAETITRAFRKLAKLYHPDGNPQGGAETAEMFKAISVAYETLRDDRSRASYDAELRHEAQAASSADDPGEDSSRSYVHDEGSESSAEEQHCDYHARYEYHGPGGYQLRDDLVGRLKALNRRWRIALWWTPSLIGFPFFAWLEARRITGNKRYTRLMLGYLGTMALIGASNLTGLLVLYWLVGMAHAGSQHRTVKAQAIARLAFSP
jgi:curved DNA-binding protein CbpA